MFAVPHRMVDPTSRPPERGRLPGPQPVAEASILTGLADAFGFDAAAVVDLPAGTDVGSVTIVRLLAEGGMGRVYEGRQQAPARSVAVKVLRDGVASPERVRRFAQEAQLLARLKHPHIAQVYLLGTFPHGDVVVPFFVMELVDEALPIDQFVRRRCLSAREAITLFRKAIAAVAYGHRVGVVHRDLKPGNILVGGDGEPKVIDFGVARCTDADLTLTTWHGGAGGIVGTLRYMSPEQFDGDSSAIDARTDVHALGLVLHEILTGDLPYDVRGKSLVVAARIIREQEPRVEAGFRTLAAAARIDAAEVRSLVAIVGKCLQKRPGDRYASADDFDADLGRWLAGEPVHARPLRHADRCRRWLHRHRSAATAIALALVVVSLAVATVGGVSLQVRSQRDLVERHRVAAAEQLASAGVETAYARVRQAAEARDRGNLGLARSLVAEARSATPGGSPPIELAVLSALLDDAGTVDESLAVLRGHADLVTSVAAADGAQRIATGSEDGTARLWERDDDGAWRDARILEGHAAAIWGVAFSPDGERLATAAADRTACIWDADDGARTVTLRGHLGPVYGVAFAADGELVATASGDHTVRLWSAADGGPRGILDGHADTVFGVHFSPDGTRLATASRDRTVRVWDIATREQAVVLTGHERRVFNVCFSPDGGRLASASEDGTVRLWHVESRGLVTVLRHPLRVNDVAFSGDGENLATASVDGLLRIWDPQSARETHRLRGHAGGIWAVAPVAAGGFVTGSADTTARIWDAAASDEPVLRCGSGVQGVAIAPDGELLATALNAGAVIFWDRATLREVRRVAVGPARVNAVAFSPDGERLAAACHDGAVRLFRVADGEPAGGIGGNGRPLYALAFSPDGARFATACDDGGVRVYDAVNGSPIDGPFKHPRRSLGVAWSPDGGRLATACADGSVRLWSEGSDSPDVSIESPGAAMNWVTFSTDGFRLAGCSSDATVRVWDAATGRPLVVLDGPVGQIWEMAFSPDGSRIAGVGADRRLHLWETVGGRHLVALEGHADEVWAVAFAPDGQAILTGSWDGTARLWGCSASELHRRRAAPPR